MSIVILLISVFAPCFIIGFMVYRVVQRGIEISQLVKDGVPTDGTIIKKTNRYRKKSGRRYYVTYQYRLPHGALQSYRSQVSQTFYDQHEINGRIKIFVSQSKPSVSAPQYLVDEAKKALAKRIG